MALGPGIRCTYSGGWSLISKMRAMAAGLVAGDGCFRAEERFHQTVSSLGGASRRHFSHFFTQQSRTAHLIGVLLAGPVGVILEQGTEVSPGSSECCFFHADDSKQKMSVAWSLHQEASGYGVWKPEFMRRLSRTSVPHRCQHNSSPAEFGGFLAVQQRGVGTWLHFLSSLLLFDGEILTLPLHCAIL